MAWSCWPYNSLSTPIAPLGPAQPRRPQEEIPFFFGVVGFVLMPVPRLGHPDRCRPQQWRCPEPGHPFTRFLAVKGRPATRRFTRFQWGFYEGRKAFPYVTISGVKTVLTRSILGGVLNREPKKGETHHLLRAGLFER